MRRLPLVLVLLVASHSMTTDAERARPLEGPISLVIFNATPDTVELVAERYDLDRLTRVGGWSVDPLSTTVAAGALRTVNRYRITAVPMGGLSRGAPLTSLELFIEEPSDWAVANCQIVVEWRNGLVLRELTGSARKQPYLRRADLLVENNTDFELSFSRSWRLYPDLPPIVREDFDRAARMGDSELAAALFIGRDVIKVSALRHDGSAIASFEREIVVNNPGEGRQPAPQRLIVTDRDFGPVGILERPPARTKPATTVSVWRTAQTHTYGASSGAKLEVEATLTVTGQDATMQLAAPFQEYELRGTMAGNSFEFQIFSSLGQHGSGRFTFSGNAFSGTWKDNWQKGGTWVGVKIR